MRSSFRTGFLGGPSDLSTVPGGGGDGSGLLLLLESTVGRVDAVVPEIGRDVDDC